MKIDSRMKNMLITDKHFNSDDLVRVLRCDIYELLSNYMEIGPSDINLDFFVDENGEYVLKINTKSERLKIFGSTIN